jgi:hypothetical protein
MPQGRCCVNRILFGKLIGDRGYISQALFEQLLETLDVQLITNLKCNMKNRLMPLVEKLLLRKRSIIETVNDQLKTFHKANIPDIATQSMLSSIFWPG